MVGPGHKNNGMVLYGDHDESDRDCTSLHELARLTGKQMTSWKPLRHHMNNISKVLLQWLQKNREQFTREQELGMTTLKALLKSDIPRNPEGVVAAVDAIFFSKLLQGRVKVSVIDMKTNEGETYFTEDSIPRTPRITIIVHNFNSKDYENHPEERRLRIVSVLIHEMCHAFLLIYGCDGRQCATWDAVANGRGFTGHGPTWDTIACEAEIAFQEYISPMLGSIDEADEPLGIIEALKEEQEYKRKWF
jgi:hypothetical protein